MFSAFVLLLSFRDVVLKKQLVTVLVDAFQFKRRDAVMNCKKDHTIINSFPLNNPKEAAQRAAFFSFGLSSSSKKISIPGYLQDQFLF